MEKDDFEWTPFNNDQINFRNELLQLASNDYQVRVYEGSHFLGFLGSIKRKEKNEQSKTRKLKRNML